MKDCGTSLEYMGIRPCISYPERHNLLTNDTFIVKNSDFIWKIYCEK